MADGTSPRVMPDGLLKQIALRPPQLSGVVVPLQPLGGCQQRGGVPHCAACAQPQHVPSAPSTGPLQQQMQDNYATQLRGRSAICFSKTRRA